MNTLVVDRDGPVAIVTLNRPEVLNALSSALCRQLCETLASLDNDETVHALILTGAGDRAFSAGVDLKELETNSDAIAAIEKYDPVCALKQCRTPVIGAINGVALTGGLEVALGCDMLIAANNARFADTHARVGLLPGWGLSQRLSRLIGVKRAQQMSLSGNFIDAPTALAWGLVNEMVAPEQLLDRACALATDIAGADRAFIRRYKALIDRGFDAPLGAALEMERQTAWSYNRSVSTGAIKDRRQGVMARGRDQKGDG